MGAAIAAMVLGCANGILEAISCEAAIDMATPWLLAGIRDLLKASSEIAEIFGAGFGSAMQVVLQALMVSIDAAEGFLNLLNLFTLGDVGASKLVDTANVLAEGVQTNVGLAKAGFNLVESSEGPVAYYRQQWQEFKQSSDRFFSVGNGIINTITMGILPDTFASDWENFQAAWQAWYDNGFPAS